MKYISFIITCGGDAGWRFTNGEEWHSMEFQLLFDAKLWTMERIKETFADLKRQINRKHSFTLSEEMDNGEAVLKPFLNKTEGVYAKKDYPDKSSGFTIKRTLWFADENKVIDPPAEEIISWELNGSTRNYN